MLDDGDQTRSTAYDESETEDMVSAASLIVLMTEGYVGSWKTRLTRYRCLSTYQQI